jgi:hypothetical protein
VDNDHDIRTKNAGTEPEAEAETGPTVVLCAGCDETTENSLNWVCSVEGGERRYFCESCARAHIRAIEGRLDSPWW